MKRLSRDVAAGLLFVGIGVAALVAGSDYRSGTLLNMGPGYFPRIVSALMIVLGALVTLAGLRQRTESTSRPWPWRALVLILGGLVLFGLALERVGLIVAVVALIATSAFAERERGILEAISLSAVLAALAWLVFVKALGLPMSVWPEGMAN